MKVLSIIPARGGSKGIPKKNIIDLGGKPLIAWSIEASKKSKYISKTIVSSDDEQILKVAKDYGVIPIKRDRNLAKDDTKTQDVLFDLLNNLEEKFDYIILLQATSPLRNEKHIDEAFEKLKQTKNKALISVYEPEHSPLKAFIVDNDILKGIVNDEYPFSPRQSLPKVYYPNGAIYIVDYKEFLKEKSLFIKNNTSYYIMDKDISKDIDKLEDLEEIRKII